MNQESEGFDALVRSFAQSPLPIYVVDRRYRIVYANQALSDWLEMASHDLLNRQLAYHSDSSAESKVDAGVLGLCPPPSALRGKAGESTVSCVGRSGALRHRRAQFVPLDPRDPQADGPVVAFVQPYDLTPEQLAVSLPPTAPPDQLHLALMQWRRSEFAPYVAAALLGNSPAIRRAADQARGAAASGANVLVTGPAAGDLQSVAEAIHVLAHPSHDAPLTRLEPPYALPEELRKALAATTSGRGTLLLVDVDQLDQQQQHDLATHLTSHSVKWRTIATLPDGGVRPLLPELFSALATVEVRLPPLAERLEDIPLLAQWHLEQLNRDRLNQVEAFTTDALERMSLYDWPGEQQELHQVVAAAYEQAEGAMIEARDLPPLIRHAVSHAQLLRQEVEPIDLDDYIQKVEQWLIGRAMQLARGNKAEAARLLGLNRPRLYRKLEGSARTGKSAGERPPRATRPPRPPREPREQMAPIVEPKEEIEFLPIDSPADEDEP